MILIVGASGRLGSVVAEHLLAQGKPVRAMTRTPLNLAQLEQQGAEVVSGDLRNPASLLSACQGVEQVLAAAHALVGKGDNNPQTVDDAGNRHLIDAAKAAGVKHFIFVSVQGASPDSPLEFFRIKYRTEEYLRASGLSFTILRSGAFMALWAQLIGWPLIEQGKTRAKKRHVPLPMMRVMSILMQPINPAVSRQIRAGIYMDTANLCCDMTETARAFGIPLTPLEELARRVTASAGSFEEVSSEKR